MTVDGCRCADELPWQQQKMAQRHIQGFIASDGLVLLTWAASGASEQPIWTLNCRQIGTRSALDHRPSKKEVRWIGLKFMRVLRVHCLCAITYDHCISNNFTESVQSCRELLINGPQRTACSHLAHLKNTLQKF